jgi:probable phosphoglycerate mutase
MELILVRHGLPVRSRETSDPPLADAGRIQARKVAARLARERIDVVASSTMHRAIQTAEPLAALTGHTIETHEGVVEFDRETTSYMPMEELKRDDYEAWKRFVARGRDPENVAAFQRVVVETLESVVAAHRGRRVAVFCHGGVINVWTAHVLSMPPRLFFEPQYASIHRYLCASTGQRNLFSLNDIAHLQGC